MSSYGQPNPPQPPPSEAKPPSLLTPSSSSSVSTLTSADHYAEEEDDQSRCALCRRRRFSDAKVLPCLHTFCKRCLQVCVPCTLYPCTLYTENLYSVQVLCTGVVHCIASVWHRELIDRCKVYCNETNKRI